MTDYFDKLYILNKDRIFSNNLLNIKENNKLSLTVQATSRCPNHCAWCCMNCTEQGEDFNLDAINDLLPFTNYVGLTGGEALIHPELTKFVNDYTKNQKGHKTIGLMTSGIAPNAPEEMKELYYTNLENILRKGNIEYDQNKMVSVHVNFTYSDGIKPRERLKDFLIKYKDIKESYNASVYLYFSMNSIRDINVKNEIIDVYEEVYGYKEEDLRAYLGRIVGNGRTGELNTDLLSLPGKCKVFDNELIIRFNGDLNICCSTVTEIKKLIPYANVYEHSFNEIVKRKSYYQELLNEFHELNGKNCINCVNGFNDFLKEKYLFKN